MMLNSLPLTNEELIVLRRQIVDYHLEDESAFWDPSSRTYLLMDLLDEYGLKIGGVLGENLMSAARLLRRRPVELEKFRELLRPIFAKSISNWPVINDSYQERLKSVLFSFLKQANPPWAEIKELLALSPKYRFQDNWDGIVWHEGAELIGHWVGKIRRYLEVSDPLRIISLKIQKFDDVYVTLDLRSTNLRDWEKLISNENIRSHAFEGGKRYYLNNIYPMERFILVQINGKRIAYTAESFVDYCSMDHLAIEKSLKVTQGELAVITLKGKPVKLLSGSRIDQSEEVVLFSKDDQHVGIPVEKVLGNFWSVSQEQQVVDPVCPGIIRCEVFT